MLNLNNFYSYEQLENYKKRLWEEIIKIRNYLPRKCNNIKEIKFYLTDKEYKIVERARYLVGEYNDTVEIIGGKKISNIVDLTTSAKKEGLLNEFKYKQNSYWIKMITKVMNENLDDKYVVKILMDDTSSEKASCQYAFIVIMKENFDINQVPTYVLLNPDSYMEYFKNNDFVLYDCFKNNLNPLGQMQKKRKLPAVLPGMSNEIKKKLDDEILLQYKSRIGNMPKTKKKTLKLY